MKALFLTGAAVVLGLISGAAAAQTAGTQKETKAASPTGALEEIIVTANRREQKLQDVGASIAAFTGEQLQDLKVVTAADIANVTPNIQVVRSYAGAGFNTQITIRGVGQPDFSDTTEATATSYIDEFYMIGAGQADYLQFDVARVEVARGPQGTVQGRNSTAGSINYYTNAPSLKDFGGQISASFGEHRLVRTQGFINIPASDTVAFRASFATDRNQGYIRNISPLPLYALGGATDFFAGRLQMLIQPSDSFSFKLKGEYGESGPTVGNEKAIQTGTIAGLPGTYRAPFDALGQNNTTMGSTETDIINTTGPNAQFGKLKHVLARADWKVNEQWNVVALAGWLKNEKNDIETCDHTPRPLCLFSNRGESKHTTAEVRANYDGGGWRLTAGANYLKQDIDSRSATPLFFDPTSTFAIFGPTATGMYTQTFHDEQDLKSSAVFGQAEFDFADRWTFIAGARYTHDKKEFTGFDAVTLSVPLTTPIPRTIDQFLALGDFAAANAVAITAISPATDGDLAKLSKGLVNANLQLNYKPSADVLLYGAIRRGVKGGGFISGNASGTPNNLRKYKEDENTAFEVGAKTTLADRRLRLNAALFYYDYKDMQNTSFIGITNVITNNDATLYGAEVEFTSNVTDRFEVSGGAGYVHTKVDKINNPTGAVAIVKDNELPLAPKTTLNLLGRYTWPARNGHFWVQGAGSYRSAFWRDSLNNPSTRIEGHSAVDALIGYGPQDERWQLTAWVNNVFDSRKEINAFDLVAVGGTGEVVYQPPRWFGATFTMKF